MWSHAWLASRPTAGNSSPRPLSAIAIPSSTSHPLCLAQPSRRTWTEPETGEPQIDRLPRPALATGLSLTGSGRRELAHRLEHVVHDRVEVPGDLPARVMRAQLGQI